MNFVKCISLLLVIIGALNWGLIGIFQFNLIAALFGEQSILARIIYSLIGISGIFLILRSSFRSTLCGLKP